MRGERRAPYAEDSTKGGSLINPLNYKGDVLVQVWVDSRVLATLCGWLEKQGTYPIHLSQVARKPLEVLAEVLVNGGDAELIDDTVEARDMLQKRFKIDLSRGGRGTKNVQHNITLSIRREELAESVQRGKRFSDVNRPLRQMNKNPLVNATIDKYYELYPERAEQSSQRSEEFKIDRSKIYDDTKPVVRGTEHRVLEDSNSPLKMKMTPGELEERMRKNEEEENKKLAELNSFDPMTLMGSAVKDKEV